MYLTRMISLVTICAIASPIVINIIARLFGIWGSNGVYVVAFFVFLFLGALLAYRISMLPLLAGCIALVGIAIGVFIDATMDFFLRAFDRNLWPVEIIIWWVFAPVPMALGALVGKRLRRNRQVMQ